MPLQGFSADRFTEEGGTTHTVSRGRRARFSAPPQWMTATLAGCSHSVRSPYGHHPTTGDGLLSIRG